MPCDGTFVTATAKWEKRNIAYEIPIWDPGVCIQCGKCSMVCPHAAIRMNVYEPECLAGAPEAFRSIDAKQKDYADLKFTIQVAPEDCTGMRGVRTRVSGEEQIAGPTQSDQHDATSGAP